MKFQRDPIHLGSGEPVLLLHPFLCSQEVWTNVARNLADTGRYEVFTPTMVGHYGGPRTRSWLLGTHAFADEVERQLDALGWETAHIVGNSLGGWVSFELERRGRARSLTAIAPAGGWSDMSPVKFEIVGKFIAGGYVTPSGSSSGGVSTMSARRSACSCSIRSSIALSMSPATRAENCSL